MPLFHVAAFIVIKIIMFNILLGNEVYPPLTGIHELCRLELILWDSQLD